ncbi:DUF1127 domain-containing protein [Bradyrhizobium sp. STM 3557]|uniref:DUF1127 domain-containing protein n=1 Tax=Bradyrhizobium sp. STM 3557 TaxID=578920 RepID=UPI00388F90DF
MSTCVSSPMTNHHAHSGFGGFLSGLGELLQTWRQRYQARHELARWSERDLHDLGLSRGDVAFEIDKPFWRA